MPRQRKSPIPATCHPEKPARARGLCDACYQRVLYWEDPDKGRALARRSNRLARQKKQERKIAERVVAILEREGVIVWHDEGHRIRVMEALT